MVLSFGRPVGCKYATQKLEELYLLQHTWKAKESSITDSFGNPFVNHQAALRSEERPS